MSFIAKPFFLWDMFKVRKKGFPIIPIKLNLTIHSAAVSDSSFSTSAEKA